MKAKLANHGKCLGGIWSALGKEKRPRNLIHRLKIPNTNPPQYERNTKRMAEITWNYHDSIQNKDINPDKNPEDYEMLPNEVLSEIPLNQCLEKPDNMSISWKVTEDQVRKALH